MKRQLNVKEELVIWKDIVLAAIVFAALMVIVGLCTIFMSSTLCGSVLGMIIAVAFTKLTYSMYRYYLGIPRC